MQQNSIWQFFASIRLALVTIFLIAITSIIGTIIPQKKSLLFYQEQYGPKIAQLFEILDIPDMYGSWWFVLLLFLLSFNLVICSIDRFPAVWKIMQSDGLSFSFDRIKRMSFAHEWQVSGERSSVISELLPRLTQSGWTVRRQDTDDGTLLFSQRGVFTRAGVYIVHTSILVIFLGAIIGSLMGFKGSIYIKELDSTSRINLFSSDQSVDLGFEVSCQSFTMEFYDNGAPKEYTSHLKVIENQQVVKEQHIEVNSPLKHRGITFYQSSYQPFEEFLISIENLNSGDKKELITRFQTQEYWDEENITIGIINARARGRSIVTSKIWLKKDDQKPVTFWLDDGQQINVPELNNNYQISVKQRYATGLQVAKDPGVWWVYIGCALMMVGLYIAFFMSHRRIWLQVSEQDGSVSVLLAGSTNKNKPGFEKQFQTLIESLNPEST